MTSTFAVLLIMNNSFHDVATAMPAACGLTMFFVSGSARAAGGPAATTFALHLHRKLSRLVFYSLVWISLGAIPRALAFTTVEWRPELGAGYIAGLMARHIFALALLVGGAFLWIGINRKMKGLNPAGSGQ